MCTSHDHDHIQGHHEIRIYWWVALVTLLTLILEIGGGLSSNSVALLSDALHVAFDLSGHILSIGIAYYIHYKPQDKAKEGKIRAKGGIVSSLLLFITVGLVFKAAIEKLISPEEIKSGEMIIYAALGLLGNAFSLWLLAKNKEHHATHILMDAHIRSDLLQSVGVVVAGIIIFFTQWHIFDAISTFLIGISLLIISVKAFKKSRAALR